MKAIYFRPLFSFLSHNLFLAAQLIDCRLYSKQNKVHNTRPIVILPENLLDLWIKITKVITSTNIPDQFNSRYQLVGKSSYNNAHALTLEKFTTGESQFS